MTKRTMAKRSTASEPRFWKSLEELAGTEDFRKLVEDEFPHRTPDWNEPSSRRRFLTLMGASVALAGASGCTKQPVERIVPYVRQPEIIVPGQPLYYATAMSLRGIGTGVLAESHMGRPTKIEGNELHPASLGGSDAVMQASVLTLYDPDRSQTVLHNGSISGWGGFAGAMGDAIRNSSGRGVRLLTGTVTSPTLASQIQRFLATFPEARWHQWEPYGRHADRAGSVAAFGQPLNTMYRFDRARVIVSLDADFLDSSMPGHLRYTRDYTRSRRMAAQGSGTAPRLYVAESSPSLAGGMAEHRIRLRDAEIEIFAAKLARSIGLEAEGPDLASPVLDAVARDLIANAGASIVVAGEFQPPRVHAIAHALNQRLGNAGQTVLYSPRVEENPSDDLASIANLVQEMRDGTAQTLLILGGNPVYDAPADLDFLPALQRVPLRVHFGLYENETAEWCHWHIPEAHYLESWSDTRAYDGTASIVQPLIAPIYGGKTAHDVLNVLVDRADRSSHDTVREHWRTRHAGADFDDFWSISLHDGIVPDSAFPTLAPPAAAPILPPPAQQENGLEITLRPDPVIVDGVFANNAWLQELPKPQDKITWDNAAWISAATAAERGVTTGDRVELALGDRTVEAPVWIMPGQADNSIRVQLGYGHTHLGKVANGVGFNAFGLRLSGALWRGHGAALKQIAGQHAFAATQHTQSMQDREPFRVATFSDYQAHPEAVAADEHAESAQSLFPMWQYPDHKWGMAIDLTACIGCGACSAACQAENNIPVVGKEEVIRGRHMHWIRVDRYFSGPVEDPDMFFQPVPCMHCETAPCELVCPVAATVHSGEGLNEMIYNRCVGTRYCSNNCPYKVRRFNFFLYSDWYTESLKGVRNPDVTVRSRGVMEKCTYCVQRIERAKIDAQLENRRVRDGEIVTACQQACPAQAIVFGDLNDPQSEVVRRKHQERDYGLLDELNTRPRTTYQARLRNPNQEIEGA